MELVDVTENVLHSRCSSVGHGSVPVDVKLCLHLSQGYAITNSSPVLLDSACCRRLAGSF